MDEADNNPSRAEDCARESFLLLLDLTSLCSDLRFATGDLPLEKRPQRPVTSKLKPPLGNR